ncbi:multifunctional oxoglutarate decarboxylase/oxoglutarate dehydrogenase thiamine pyrophosphate-binding subunit/dihydrolipoyllysine-residue succinyltransferase subunit [Propionibacterium freudenreichii]|uniref:multifunctional oxoglutarate decarboxylase/oxoglutarate dehydrogenase thiamine pyrophosphate-binding subunit/dihydrolipoyllysine-residue succinyltransferase subunit n=1 Tax=Propionibacterium freudenreichii TaxID=1744 RepID=UPI00254B7FA1|nr:multifunctional oxoglutarate decarboxylase/oxoglutarate dehydrogenase thiamine pyrophosphate-binding subunit/dihydrolipoyllysine-residue succinyltransferase subunit [Propionibacterium freudenreichii]MDK9319586.1 multifunctional oxoglutarate decarboxylase/oxoglutarate dehydrogenase thiamine pyrophosphate-binding subunit/dihydrolipoyllysine-residue succinyltransferase subunit [Propionibacterium freudenreichii]MDK9343624.1 multifunctional oxoglutarate decarboxylase/oxoglutarate dehydrogenase thia
MGTDKFGANDWLIADMRQRYLADPTSVDERWRAYFQALGVTPDPSTPVASPAPVTPAPTQAPTPQASTPQAPTSSAPGPNEPAQPPSSRVQAPVPALEPREIRRNAPEQPGMGGGLSADVPNPAVRPAKKAEGQATRTVLRGIPKTTAVNMNESLSVPTATSVRQVPMKLVIDNRALVNSFMARTRGGKVSFTHIIAFAMVQAIRDVPEMNHSFDMTDGKPTLVENPAINLGIAIDTTAKNGTRELLVPNIKDAGSLDFAQFWSAYEDLVDRTRSGKLTLEDYAGTTVSITNPGGIGTNMSVPRLMSGQAMIMGVGSIDYPAAFQGTSTQRTNDAAISKVCTLTSTYDHRIIQGAVSGEFLRRIHQLLLGADGFYEHIYEALRIPYPPLHWDRDFTANSQSEISKGARVTELIQAYRAEGHLLADLDPVEYRMRTHPDLDLATHGLSIWDLDREFPVGRFGGEEGRHIVLRQMLDILRESYCYTLAIEYMHIDDPEERAWVQERFERPRKPRPREEHLLILDRLSEAEVFETFLQTKYVGQTRFSMEGAESSIVILSELCAAAADGGMAEVSIGMPHRGRLNVLTNVVGKLYSQVFREFDNKVPTEEDITGDVKYHLGATGQFTAMSGEKIKVSLAANPSHLEAVDPVLEGIARAKRDRQPVPADYPVLPILMHGDASFSAQGIVYEVLQMSQLRPYRVGGTVHLVVNNQLGFTTSPSDGRSSKYCTDVAKALGAPVIHVNGDDPDACARAAELAFDFRARFHKDVVIDMVCYRLRGHNEGDDPSFTQPQMYDLVARKGSVRKIYTDALIGRGDISVEDAEQAVNRFRARLEEVFSMVRNPEIPRDEVDHQVAYRLAPQYPAKERAASAPPTPTREQFERVADVYENLPEGFTPHPKVGPQLKRRADSIHNGPVDWATAELLAFGTLLQDRRHVRLVGQDTRRGTFSQRFGAVVDRVTNEAWVPLKHLSDDQAPFDIYDSNLTEYAGMGFEYGYSTAAPDALVLWEAQYGDFANGAQTIADEFISSGFAKWQQRSGVVLLLPHGYEGAGPDHSSCRIERWLQTADEGNIAVTMPSTAASYFHLLRQQAYVNWHRPLVVATPKSMLRNKAAASPLSDLLDEPWRPALADPTITDPGAVRRVLLCAGKIRWDLVAERRKLGLDGQIAIVSLERLFPLPTAELAEILRAFPQVNDFRYVQEEPENQGAWEFMDRFLTPALSEALNRPFRMRPVTRPRSSAPSVGSHTVHLAQQRSLLAESLGQD